MTKQMLQSVFALVLLALFSPDLWAAECTDVFGDPASPRENLQASGDTLDLSGVAFADNGWPASNSTLADGDYFFSGANLGNNYTLNIAPGAQVRIFVSGSLGLGNNATLNGSGNPGQLLLVTRGSLSSGNKLKVNGFIYSSGSIAFGNRSAISGAVSSAGSSQLGSNNDFQGDERAYSNGLLEGLCEAPSEAGLVSVSANGVSAGPVAAAPEESVMLEAEVRDCPVDTYLFTRRWTDTWVVDGVVVASDEFNASPCVRGPLTRTETFSDEDLHEVEFRSEFTACFLGFYCGGKSLYDSDSIQIETAQPADALTCFDDDYTADALADDWVTAVSGGSFTPGISSNHRLRLTTASGNQATSVTLQREIPGTDNLVVLEFDYYAYGGSGADGIAIALSDASVTPRPGGYGGSLGYAQGTGGGPGFAGGWLGIGLDEYGNFSNQSEGRQGGRNGRTKDSIAIRGAAPDYQFLRATQSLDPGVDSPGNNNPAAQRYRIVIDAQNPGEAIVSIERDITGTGDNFQELIAPFNALNEPGQPAIPENLLLSLTGSTGGSTNIHELDNFQLCAQKLNPVGRQVDHFEIEHDGVALTCQPEPVTVRACANADCSELFTDPVNATMSPSGWVGGDVISITGGATQARLAHRKDETVALDVVGSDPSTRPQAVTLCRRGNSGLSANNCETDFRASGLAFDVPDMVAGRPLDNAITISALEQSDTNPEQCVPAFADVTRDVDFWSTYLTPDDSDISVAADTTVDGDAVGKSSGNATTQPLDFDSQGSARINVGYPEAGKVRLSARYQGSAANDDVGLELPGADAFVSKPAGFCIEATPPTASCANGSANCTVLAKAGENFAVRTRAVAWQADGESGVALCSGNATTKNFRATDLTLNHALVAPVSPGDPGTLGTTSESWRKPDNGNATYNQSISEVGAFQLTVPANQTWLDGVALPGATSATIGRLVPAGFDLSVSKTGDLKAASCEVGANFTYTGKSFSWGVSPPEATIRAYNVAGNTTKNYTRGSFEKLGVAGISRQMPTADNDQMLADSSGKAPVVYSPGSAKLSPVSPGVMHYLFATDDSLTYTRSRNTRVGPFMPSLSFDITRVQDTDGVQASAVPLAIDPAADFEVRYGRWAMDNVFGPENAGPLVMTFRTEYWKSSAGRFVVNAADSCTNWNTDDITGPEIYHETPSTAGIFNQGQGTILLDPKPQSTPLPANPTDELIWTVPYWLQGYWDDDNSPDNPSALATFGVYRGNDRVIYWREK